MPLTERIHYDGRELRVDGPQGGSYLYRYVRLNMPSEGDGDYNTAHYGQEVNSQLSTVLEIKDGEERVLIPAGNLTPTLRLSMIAKKGRTELRFTEDNLAVHMSRIYLQDESGNRVPLGNWGTVNRDCVWYLPENASWRSYSISTDEYCAVAVTVENR